MSGHLHHPSGEQKHWKGGAQLGLSVPQTCPVPHRHSGNAQLIGIGLGI